MHTRRKSSCCPLLYPIPGTALGTSYAHSCLILEGMEYMLFLLPLYRYGSRGNAMSPRYHSQETGEPGGEPTFASSRSWPPTASSLLCSWWGKKTEPTLPLERMGLHSAIIGLVLSLKRYLVSPLFFCCCCYYCFLEVTAENSYTKC